MKRLLLLSILLFASCQSLGSGIHLVDLQVDYETTPLMVEGEQPQFSWRMDTNNGQGRQRAYQVTVVTESGDVAWSTGRVENDQSVGIVYAGEPLLPTSRYSWEVKVWDASNGFSSASSWFETGLMHADASAWSGARWIGGGENDRVFQANYLSVFTLRFDVALDAATGSQQAAFLFGGNDFRLLDKNLNIQQVENAINESFIALELDTSGLTRSENLAHLNIYRVGYTADDRRAQPFARLPIPRDIINAGNQYEPHQAYIESVFGVLNIYINGSTDDHRITAYNADLPPYMPQGLTINPNGSGGNFIAYPMLGDVGFWVKSGQVAQFSNIEIRHWREPKNILFTAGSPAGENYREILLPEDNQAISLAKNGAYHVSPDKEALIYLADPSRNGVPMLRREFELDDKPIKKARLYATARGIYELYINGERVGNDYFAPGLTQYNKHHTYQIYDVTRQLTRNDSNVFGAWLSEGWWSGNITYSGTNWNYFGDRQSFLARLVVTYEDGSTYDVVTEPASWRVYHGGPVRYGSFFQGEIYDAVRESRVEGWTRAGYDDSQWRPAQLVPLEGSAFMGDPAQDDDGQLITNYDNMKLIGHSGNSPRIVKTLTAKSVTEVRPGVFLYDMGQNMVGVPRIQLHNQKTGQPVILRYAEVLYPDLPEHKDLAGRPMMENLRAALVHDIYYPKGGEETIQPRFTFHGYRYLEISGIEQAPPPEAVSGLVVSSVTELAAGYETSNPLVNKLWDNITWSLRGNFLSIPTDTPARNERMGWSGDLNVFARTANYMAHINPFIKRHMLAMRDLQSPAGRFPDVAPVGGGFGGTLWGAAGVVVPWETYRLYGDVSLLRGHYAAMVRYIDFLQNNIDSETSLLMEGPLGDWLSPEGERNDNSLLWEAYHVYLLDIMTQVASVLDKPDDFARFQQLHTQRKTFFNTTYVDGATGKTISSGVVVTLGQPARLDKSVRGNLVDTQASYAIPIALDVFNEANRRQAEQHLANAVIRENIDDSGVKRPAYSLMTGFIGTASLLDALSQTGNSNIAYRLLQQTSYPSWLYSVVNGSTTIWERLNSYTREDGFGGNNSMNSFNHYAFGAVGSWMLSRSLGIRPGKGSAGFKHFVLAPTPDPGGQMTWAKGYYDSMYGRIESSWAREDGDMRYRFVVPENTMASLRLPVAAAAAVLPVSGAARPMGDKGEYTLSPGTYEFRVSVNRP